MDQRTFVFATRGRCIKGKQCQHVTLKNKTICLCSKQSILFSFYALPSGGKPEKHIYRIGTCAPIKDKFGL